MQFTSSSMNGVVRYLMIPQQTVMVLLDVGKLVKVVVVI